MPVQDKDLFAIVPDDEVVNQIYPFCDQGVDNRDLLSLEDYKGDAQRSIGHQPGIARAKLANRQARQASHISAGIAQFLARRYLPGIVDDGDPDKVEAALAKVLQMVIYHAKYDVGEIYPFLDSELKPGMAPCYGAVITEADLKYPEIWEFLQTEKGQGRRCTEEEWQAATHAVWHTNANGTQVGWNGIGGCAKFVINTTAKTIRLPDLRGILMEFVGGPASPAAGACMGDAARQVTGSFFPHAHVENAPLINYPEGAFYHNDAASSMRAISYSAMTTTQSFKSKVLFNSGRMVPIAAVNRPRSFGVIPCAYLGMPAPDAA